MVRIILECSIIVKSQLNKIAVIVGILLLAACDSPKLNLVDNDGVILAFGDSLTYGVGAGNNVNYPKILSELSGIEVINSGVSGETTDQGLRRLPSELARYNPNLMLLIEGGNDILRHRDHALIKNDLSNMINIANRYGVQVVLIGVPKKSLFSNSAKIYHELADEYDLVFDGELIGGLMRSPSLKSDPIHFNEKGYRKMAKSIYELLKENGALH